MQVSQVGYNQTRCERLFRLPISSGCWSYPGSTYVHVLKTHPRDPRDPGFSVYSPQTTGDCYRIWSRQSFCLSVSHNHSAARTVEG